MKLKAGQFYGETSRTLAIDNFRFTEKAYSARGSIPFHAHELAHFCFVLGGSYHERIGGCRFDRKPAALVYYPADLTHAEEHFTDGRHLLVEIDGPGLTRAAEYGASLDRPATLGSPNSMQLAARMYAEFRDADSLSPLALECIVNELLIESARQAAGRKRDTPPRWLEDVKECLRHNIVAPPDLNGLAAIAGVHPTHVARTFRRFEKCTAGEFVRRVRVEKASERLSNSDLPLVEIALELGFADQSHFSHAFRSGTGFTPAEFRRLAQTR